MTGPNGWRLISRTHGRRSASTSPRSDPVSRGGAVAAAQSSSASSANISFDGHQR